ALARPLDRRHDRGELCQQQLADALDVLEADVVGLRVESPEERHGGREGVHGIDVPRQGAELVEDGLRDVEAPRDLGLAGVQLGARGELALPEQVDDLLEARLVRELPYVVAAVDQLALGAVDVADRADIDVDAFQAAVDRLFHRLSLPRRAAGPGRCGRRAPERASAVYRTVPPSPRVGVAHAGTARARVAPASPSGGARTRVPAGARPQPSRAASSGPG